MSIRTKDVFYDQATEKGDEAQLSINRLDPNKTNFPLAASHLPTFKKQPIKDKY